MDIKKFKIRARELDLEVKKVNSAYWGKTWWDVSILAPAAHISFQFEENKPLNYVMMNGNHSHHVTAVDLKKTAEIFQAVADLVEEINRNL